MACRMTIWHRKVPTYPISTTVLKQVKVQPYTIYITNQVNSKYTRELSQPTLLYLPHNGPGPAKVKQGQVHRSKIYPRTVHGRSNQNKTVMYPYSTYPITVQVQSKYTKERSCNLVQVPGGNMVLNKYKMHLQIKARD